MVWKDLNKTNKKNQHTKQTNMELDKETGLFIFLLYRNVTSHDRLLYFSSLTESKLRKIELSLVILPYLYSQSGIILL